MSTAERDARIARIIADIKSICEVLEPGSITGKKGGEMGAINTAGCTLAAIDKLSGIERSCEL